MKIYGTNKATEFSKKQINVLYSLAKSGTLIIEKWYIQYLYNLAEYYRQDFNRSVERDEASVKSILDAVFEKDYEKAQNLIDKHENLVYSSYSDKYKKNLDTSYLG